ncbi:MAG: hypothetical protein ACRD0P_02890 [Stackebrandtia sp.]
MSDVDDAAAEAERDPDAPVLETTMHGRTWVFHRPDIRPAALRRYARLTDKVTGSGEVADADAIELAAVAEDMLRSGLADAAEREAFDEAPFNGTDITALSEAYFDALGASVGESPASPAPSPNTVARSRPTSKRRTESD